MIYYAFDTKLTINENIQLFSLQILAEIWIYFLQLSDFMDVILGSFVLSFSSSLQISLSHTDTVFLT